MLFNDFLSLKVIAIRDNEYQALLYPVTVSFAGENPSGMIESKMNLQPAVLEDHLVRIIPLKENDFDNLFAVASDPLIWEQHPTSDRYKKEVFQIYFDSAVQSKSAFLLYDKATNDLMGSSRYYDYNPEKSRIAIGFTFLARKFWGGEYNRAVKKLMLDYAFRFVDSVLFHIGPSNIRSQKAILKIGAKKTGEVLYDGKPHFEYEVRRGGVVGNRES